MIIGKKILILQHNYDITTDIITDSLASLGKTSFKIFADFSLKYPRLDLLDNFNGVVFADSPFKLSNSKIKNTARYVFKKIISARVPCLLLGSAIDFLKFSDSSVKLKKDNALGWFPVKTNENFLVNNPLPHKIFLNENYSISLPINARVFLKSLNEPRIFELYPCLAVNIFCSINENIYKSLLRNKKSEEEIPNRFLQTQEELAFYGKRYLKDYLKFLRILYKFWYTKYVLN